MNTPKRAEEYPPIQISNKARELIQKQAQRSLIYTSTDPESVLEQYIQQSNCRFESTNGEDGKTPTIYCKSENDELVGFMEFAINGNILFIEYREKFLKDEKYRWFSTGILAYCLSNLPEQPAKIQSILSDKNKERSLHQSPAYYSFAQFGYTQATRTPGRLEHWTFEKAK